MKLLTKLLGFLLIAGFAVLTYRCERATSVANPNSPPNTTLANIPVENDTLFALQTLHWDGEDDDGFIARFEYRYTTRHLLRGDSVIQDWQNTTATSLTIAFESSDTLNYQIFQVRAIDNNGAVDPTPAERKIYTVQTRLPQTQILAPVQNQRAFVIDHTTDWWQGIKLSFTAQDLDGEVVEYGWMVDGGDTTWTKDTTLYITPDKLSLPLAGPHTIGVTSRDNTNLLDPVGDAVTINLVAPAFARDILIIDETNENNLAFAFPGVTGQARDDSVDNFYQQVFGPADTWDFFKRNNAPPPRDTLGQYRLVIWHADDRPTTTGHALPLHIDLIMDYMNVGGDFIMSGWRMLKSFDWEQNWGQNNPHSFPEGTFIHDYLHINAANETPSAPGDFTFGEGFSGFSDVQVDASKIAEFPYFGKLTSINIITDWGGFTKVIYAYQNELTGLTWPRGNPVGLQYFGTSFDAVILGFPVYFIQKDNAITLGQEVLQSMGYR
ncbi:MAG: hypothetical protein HUU32_06425 [Calditrichaceae bacterium]|nr:hypothetical protein [Calditrichia bacterium]NUQ41014.1 hypothetical protein [Calditrichaceae bacterium]